MIHVVECRGPIGTKPGTTGTLWYNKYWQTDGSKEHVLVHEGKVRIDPTRYHDGGHRQKLIQSFGAAGYAIVWHGIVWMQFANTQLTVPALLSCYWFDLNFFSCFTRVAKRTMRIKERQAVNRVAVVSREISKNFSVYPKAFGQKQPETRENSPGKRNSLTKLSQKER